MDMLAVNLIQTRILSRMCKGRRLPFPSLLRLDKLALCHATLPCSLFLLLCSSHAGGPTTVSGALDEPTAPHPENSVRGRCSVH